MMEDEAGVHCLATQAYQGGKQPVSRECRAEKPNPKEPLLQPWREE